MDREIREINGPYLTLNAARERGLLANFFFFLRPIGSPKRASTRVFSPSREWRS